MMVVLAQECSRAGVVGRGIDERGGEHMERVVNPSVFFSSNN